MDDWPKKCDPFRAIDVPNLAIPVLTRAKPAPLEGENSRAGLWKPQHPV